MSKTNYSHLSNKKFILIISFFISFYIQANDLDNQKDILTSKEIQKKEIKDYILHHLKDSHDFSLLSYTKENGEKKYIGFPLPVIIWDKGLKVFSSSRRFVIE